MHSEEGLMLSQERPLGMAAGGHGGLPVPALVLQTSKRRLGSRAFCVGPSCVTPVGAKDYSSSVPLPPPGQVPLTSSCLGAWAGLAKWREVVTSISGPLAAPRLALRSPAARRVCVTPTVTNSYHHPQRQ